MDIKSLISKHQLNHLEKEILEVAKPAVNLKLKNNFFIESGKSRFGGMPDVPENFCYPMDNGSPVPFLLQINLADLTSTFPEHNLPQSGMLYFFYDVVEQPWGIESSDAEKVKVIYIEDITNIRPINFPEGYPEEAIIKPTEIDFNPSLSFPLYDTKGYDEIPFINEDDEENYYHFVFELSGHGAHYQLFGYPENIQGDVLEELSGTGDTNLEFLLQVDSDEELDLMWGDVGMIYFAIDSDDLNNKNFSNTRFTLQCH